MAKPSAGKPDAATNTLRAQGRSRLRLLRLWFRLGLFAALIGCFFAGWFWWSLQPPGGERRTIRVSIASGTNTPAIGRILHDAGLVRSGWTFAAYARFLGANGTLKSGRYALSPDMTPAQIVAELHKGNVQSDDGIRLTIPEGWTLEQIAQSLTEKGIADGNRFLQIATDPATIARLQTGYVLPTDTLEGYLYPNTYRFRAGTSPEKVLLELLVNFDRRFARPYHQEIEASGKTLHQIVTIASLIEREAKVPQDRARIAGVIDNRLRKGMRLQIDATVIYALGHHEERVSLADLRVKSPYNTYRHKGLPPGPIASPGQASLLAALHPESSDYLYYVAQADGSHLFSRTRREHEAAIRQVR